MPAQEEKVPSQPPKVEPWVAGSGEDQAEAKELAARIAQTALRYPRGSSALEVAERVAGPGAPAKALAPTISAAVRPQWRSWARVVYPQLSGLGIDTVGTMVVVDQTVESPAGDRTTFRRVLDIRLRRAGEGYALDLLGSIGGDPVQRPADLSPAASRIVDDPRITLSDSARWDIYRGKVDDGLIEAILAIAERHTGGDRPAGLRSPAQRLGDSPGQRPLAGAGCRHLRGGWRTGSRATELLRHCGEPNGRGLLGRGRGSSRQPSAGAGGRGTVADRRGPPGPRPRPAVFGGRTVGRLALPGV